MTIKCYKKPQRSRARTFTAADVGRIVCYAIDDGENKADIRKAIAKCLDDGEETCDEVREENKKWRTVAIAIGGVAAILLARQAVILITARVALRLAINKQFRELMQRIITEEEARKKAFEDLLRRIKESEIVLIP